MMDGREQPRQPSDAIGPRRVNQVDDRPARRPAILVRLAGAGARAACEVQALLGTASLALAVRRFKKACRIVVEGRAQGIHRLQRRRTDGLIARARICRGLLLAAGCCFSLRSRNVSRRAGRLRQSGQALTPQSAQLRGRLARNQSNQKRPLGRQTLSAVWQGEDGDEIDDVNSVQHQQHRQQEKASASRFTPSVSAGQSAVSQAGRPAGKRRQPAKASGLFARI
ncbi:hypothetical protein BCR34DRAFT_606904 [Clohesyomyces aquaticus]|uniref:Uncharacterized protein n=1 Tax=Clohesyomyces aquaticus TaxID=1231657 RepID=A0A1Y1YKL3_9PLEO|nr:hypothetical protein BCR34DRAFT_606904 [Clohesyomyces aquaticus]